jgi:predicted GH43/DUF377 family glycosyl hydrolase
MRLLTRLVRFLLEKWGYEVRRIVTPARDFDDFLLQLGQTPSESHPAVIHIFDDEPRIQRTLLQTFGPCRTEFYGSHELDYPAVPRQSAEGNVWVFFSGERGSVGAFFASAPWARSAGLLFVRCSFGAFSQEGCDFADTVYECARHGLALFDVLTSVQPVLFNAINTRAILLFARSDGAGETAPERRKRIHRVDDAWAFLTSPVIHRGQFQRLTGRRSFGYEAGIFNPGALGDNGRTTLVFRAESVPWAIQEENEKIHLSSSQAFLIELDETHKILSGAKLEFRSPYDPAQTRIEDFRLFSFRGQRFANHSVVTLPEGRPGRSRPLRLELLDTRVGISALAPEQKELRFVGLPRLDFPLRQTEKNWGMLATADDLHLIYSMAPYRVLRATDWPKVEFKTAIHQRVALPFAQDGRAIRNSINPVDYDDRHFLHLVHKVYPSKQYVYWALLIDKRTLLPTYVSGSPLIRGGTSVAAAIVYACSIVARHDRIAVFGGVDDCGAGVWQLDRSALDRHWQMLPRN